MGHHDPAFRVLSAGVATEGLGSEIGYVSARIANFLARVEQAERLGYLLQRICKCGSRLSRASYYRPTAQNTIIAHVNTWLRWHTGGRKGLSPDIKRPILCSPCHEKKMERELPIGNIKRVR